MQKTYFFAQIKCRNIIFSISKTLIKKILIKIINDILKRHTFVFQQFEIMKSPLKNRLRKQTPKSKGDTIYDL